MKKFIFLVVHTLRTLAPPPPTIIVLTPSPCKWTTKKKFAASLKSKIRMKSVIIIHRIRILCLLLSNLYVIFVTFLFIYCCMLKLLDQQWHISIIGIRNAIRTCMYFVGRNNILSKTVKLFISSGNNHLSNCIIFFFFFICL